MNRTIWKLPLAIDDQQDVEMPHGAKAISVGLDPQGRLCLWAIVDPGAPRDVFQVRICGTGNPLCVDSDDRFVGSVTMGLFVWHVFICG